MSSPRTNFWRPLNDRNGPWFWSTVSHTPPSDAPVCAYCDEPATLLLEPEDSDELVYVCADHEERGIVEAGSGQSTPIEAAGIRR